MKLLFIILFPFMLFAQVSRDIEVYKGDSHTISFEAYGDISADSLLFIVKADRLDATPRVITRRNTAGGGGDSQLEVIYVSKSTILVKLTQINTEGLTPAVYVYDLTVDSTTTLYTGFFTLLDEVGGSADGVATKTPYYTIVIDTPAHSPSFIIGQDSDNSWDVVSKSAFQDSIGITAGTATNDMLLWDNTNNKWVKVAKTAYKDTLKNDANVFHVGDAANYTTISSAITAASDGDVIVIYAGSYAGFTSAKELHFIGDGKVIITSAVTITDTCKFESIDFGVSSTDFIKVDGGLLIMKGCNLIGGGSYEPAININNGIFGYSNGSINGKILIDSSNVLMNVDSLYSDTGGNYLLDITGNSQVELNVNLIDGQTTKTNNTSTLNLQVKDLHEPVRSFNTAKVYINNSSGYEGNQWFDAANNSLIEISNSYFYFDIADTTTGLHNIETLASTTEYPTIKTYNTTFYFSGREGQYNTGGSPVALSNNGRMYSYNCAYIDGGDRAGFYPQMVAVGDKAIYESYNDTYMHKGAASDALNAIIKTDTDSTNIKLYNPTFVSNSGDAVWWNTSVAPTSVDTLIIINPVNNTPEWLLVSGRSGTEIDTAKVDFNALNKINLSDMEYERNWFPHDVQIDSVLQVGVLSVLPGTTTKSNTGIIKANTYYFDGIGRHNSTVDTLSHVGNSMLSDWVELDLPKAGTAGDTLLITLNFSSKTSFTTQAVYAKLILSYDAYVNTTAMYEIIIAGNNVLGTNEFAFTVTELFNQGQGASVANIQVVSKDATQFVFRYPNAYAGLDGHVQVQVFEGINIKTITMATQ